MPRSQEVCSSEHDRHELSALGLPSIATCGPRGSRGVLLLQSSIWLLLGRQKVAARKIPHPLTRL